MDSGPQNTSASSGAGGFAVYFDGTSSRRRLVTLEFNDRLEIIEYEHTLAVWSYADIRRADSPSGTLRATCLTAPGLARLEIRDSAVAAELVARCTKLDENIPGRRGVARIVGWSVAATVSESQVKTLFGGKVCANAAGQAAFTKLVNAIRESAGLDPSIQSAVLSSSIPNAFALPGGKVYVFSGLLAKAGNADEVAGILAHEFGHLKHRDGTRNLIYNGGTSFLIGLLFGDITGSGALIFASRSLVTASYSREAEQNADTFAIETMHRLGRSPKPMGELMFRVTGKEGDSSLSILASHPLTEDRLARMSKEDRPPSGAPLLTASEWASLKAICSSDAKI